MLAAGALALGGAPFGATAAQAATEINVPDDDLRAAINSAISAKTSTTRAPDAQIFDNEVAGITNVSATASSNITDLTGLEYFTDLESLTIYGDFGSLDPIEDLQNIHSLTFKKNDNAGLTMIPIESTPRNIELSGAAFTSINDIVILGLADEIGTFYISGTDITSLDGIENVNFRDHFADSMLTFGSTASGDRSSLTDLTPIANMTNPPRSRIEILNTDVSDVTPLSGITLRQLYAYNNRIVDISQLSTDMTGFDFRSQQIELGNFALGEVVTNPLKGYNPGPVSVTSNSTGFDGQDAAGDWSFSTPGLKELDFEFEDDDYKTGVSSTGTWSGKIFMTVDGPAVSVGPSEVNPGDTVTVTGEGYLPGEDVVVTIDPSGESVTVTADENGSFTTDITVPEDAELGEYTATGVGQESDASDSDTFSVVEPAAQPTLMVDPSEVNPGDDVTINGSGFLPGEEVEVTIDGEGGTTVVQADENGSFSLDVTVPEDADLGTYTASALGLESERTASDTFDVVEPGAVSPSVTVDPSEVNPGDTVTVTGEGFLPGEEVVVTIDPSGESVTVTADEDGAFSVEVTIPEDAEPGDFTATAVGQESERTASDDFTVVEKVDDDKGSGTGGSGNDGQTPGTGGSGDDGTTPGTDGSDDDGKTSGSDGSDDGVKGSLDGDADTGKLVVTGVDGTVLALAGTALLLLGAAAIGIRNASRKYETR